MEYFLKKNGTKLLSVYSTKEEWDRAQRDIGEDSIPVLALTALDTSSYTGRFDAYQTAMGGAYTVESRSALQIQDREVTLQINILPKNLENTNRTDWFMEYMNKLKRIDSIEYEGKVNVIEGTDTLKQISLKVKYLYHSVDWLEYGKIGILTITYYDLGNGWSFFDDGKLLIKTFNAVATKYQELSYPFGFTINDLYLSGYSSLTPYIKILPKTSTSLIPEYIFIRNKQGDRIMYIETTDLDSGIKMTAYEYIIIDAYQQKVKIKVKNKDEVTLVKNKDVYGLEQFRRLEPTENQEYGFTFIYDVDVIKEIESGAQYYIEM